MGSRRGDAGAVRHRTGGDTGFDERPAQGPARGDRGHAGILDRLRGRPLLRQRLAHHRRDGWRLGTAAEARGRRLVRRRRPVGRAGDDLHQRPGLHALRAEADERAAPAPHGLRPGRPSRGALRPRAGQPDDRRQDRDGQGRRPLRAARRLSVERQQEPPDRGRQPPGHRGPARGRARVHRHRLAPRRRGPRLHRAGRLHAHARGRGPRAGLPRPAAGHGLQGRRQGRPVRMRRRPARQGHRRSAALQGHRSRQGPRGGLDRRRRAPTPA